MHDKNHFSVLKTQYQAFHRDYAAYYEHITDF